MHSVKSPGSVALAVIQRYCQLPTT